MWNADARFLTYQIFHLNNQPYWKPAPAIPTQKCQLLDRSALTKDLTALNAFSFGRPYTTASTGVAGMSLAHLLVRDLVGNLIGAGDVFRRYEIDFYRIGGLELWEAAARQKGFAVDVHTNDMNDWFSARTYAETVAWSKIIVDQATDRILGAHFVGHSGQDLINLFGLAMRFGLTAAQIRDNVYAYPTFSSDIRHMLGHG